MALVFYLSVRPATEDASLERAPKRIKLEAGDKAPESEVTSLKKAWPGSQVWQMDGLFPIKPMKYHRKMFNINYDTQATVVPFNHYLLSWYFVEHYHFRFLQHLSLSSALEAEVPNQFLCRAGDWRRRQCPLLGFDWHDSVPAIPRAASCPMKHMTTGLSD